ncbi:MAG: hypothetical protein HY884_05595 [Deltaproteobacteria bacterium]|nr:hypothetical protein [Deltaproteobacteria bacterium]
MIRQSNNVPFYQITSKTNPLGETTTIEYRYQGKGVAQRVLDAKGTELLMAGSPTAGLKP